MELEAIKWVVDKVDLPPLSRIANKVDVIIFGKDFERKED